MALKGFEPSTAGSGGWFVNLVIETQLVLSPLLNGSIVVPNYDVRF